MNKSPKRIAIYVYNPERKVVPSYVLYFLSKLKEAVNEIIVIINGKIDEKEKQKFECIKPALYERETKAPLFYCYRKGFFCIGNEKLNLYDEIIFASSNCMGPIYPFGAFFNKMNKCDVDFWSTVKCPPLNKNVINFNFEQKEYIHAHFFSVRKTMFKDPRFKNYFEDLKKIKNKNDSREFEINFTQYFKSLNFKYTDCTNNDILKYGKIDPDYIPDILIKEYTCPVIEKNSLIKGYGKMPYELYPNKIYNALSYIKNETDYNLDFIIEETVKTLSAYEIKKNLHLNYILSDKTRENFVSKKAAFIFNYIDEDFLNTLKEYIKDTFGLLDIYAINKKEPLKKDGVRITVLDNNISCFKQIKSLSGKYGAICMFVLEEENIKNLNKIQKTDYIKYLLNSVIKNRIYINNILNTFEKNPRLGILSPLPYINKAVYTKIQNKNLIEFTEKMDINIKTDIEYLKSLHNVFWIKKESIDKINDVIDFECDNGLNKGIIFSLLNQKYGFLEGNVSPVEISKVYSDTVEYNLMKK